MRRVLILLTVLLIANLAAPVAHAWEPQRDGPGLFTGGGGVPFIIDPHRNSGRVYFVTNFYMRGKRALARAIARAIAEGAYRVAPPYRVGGAP